MELLVEEWFFDLVGFLLDVLVFFFFMVYLKVFNLFVVV